MFFRRSFFTTQPTLMKWIGYKKEKLTWPFEQAVVKYKKNGAVKKVGKIKSIEILSPKDGSSPIHQSHYNRKDKELVVSARIKPVIGPARTHHIYADGTGTMKVGDKREYCTKQIPRGSCL